MSDLKCGGLDHNLSCILFPGVVKNVEKALQCMGGIRGISQVHSQPNKKRLGLSYQPDNPFVKRSFADYKKTAGVLFKVRIKKIKVKNEIKREVISTDIVGRVSSIYRFQSMFDFQYLPFYREISDGPLKCQLDITIPSGKEDLSFLSGPSPLYIVPANFTRSDRPLSYSYTDKRYPDQDPSPDADDDVHNKSRTERGLPLQHWWFFNLTKEFPTAPLDYYIKHRDRKFKINPLLQKEYENVEKCFQERPIWSLNLIKYHTKIRLTSLKIIVPCLAVYMKDGPWKTMWVRYGYDPRVSPASRIYQTLDFRLRHTAGVHSMVMTRDQIVHYKKADRVRQMKRKNNEQQVDDVAEGAVYFRPGMAPTQRQIFYQICDVKIPEVEAIVSAEPPAGATCHEKLGWLQPNDIEVCRDHIFESVAQTLLTSHTTDLKFEGGAAGSSDDDNSDEEPDNPGDIVGSRDAMDDGGNDVDME